SIPYEDFLRLYPVVASQLLAKISRRWVGVTVKCLDGDRRSSAGEPCWWFCGFVGSQSARRVLGRNSGYVRSEVCQPRSKNRPARCHLSVPSPSGIGRSWSLGPCPHPHR